ncbi:hypothetical protein BLNAU_14327 [Blattamonas nauphoetae]|uniref:Uncharacterized protein n=1 Tax=Blattamonas nauphoetae TaxID=2049346 RepID=A0ABQ9XFD6_9EUKA|nr:hypothetical protein BLNAU_14327 [Blattamonas nauphoetae]
MYHPLHTHVFLSDITKIETNCASIQKKKNIVQPNQVVVSGSINTNHSSSTDLPCPDISSRCLPSSPDCSPFLNWTEEAFDSEKEMAVVFRSLVATLRLQPVLDASLEAKAKKLLESVENGLEESADDFLKRFASSSDDSLTEFVQCIVVLLSSPSQVIINASIKMMRSLIDWCSADILLPLIKANLIPQVINTLNPHSLSFAEAEDIHICLMFCITNSLRLATPDCLRRLGINDRNEQQAVRETVLKQVVAHSEKYICHLCVNRFSLVDEDLSTYFLIVLERLLHICPYHQPAMDFVLQMPVTLTIPSCLSFFENDRSIRYFLWNMIDAQREWSKTRGYQRQMRKTMQRLLRMEGVEDVMEEKLRSDRNEFSGRHIVNESIECNNELGMNIQEQG